MHYLIYRPLEQFLSRFVAKHDVLLSLGYDEETFVHTVKQTHVLSVCDFHPLVKSTNVLQHYRQSHANSKKSEHKANF